MKKIYYAVLLILLLACKEEVRPIVTPNTNGNNGGTGSGNGSGGSNNGGTDCTLAPFTPVAGKYAACLPQLSAETLDIMTWNIEQFPKSSGTVAMLTEIISNLNPDIIAVQEINSVTSFNTLKSGLSGWDVYLPKQSGTLQVGYLYKTAEVSISDTKEIYTNESSAFPRPPLITTATHVSGKKVTLINLHLKCCDDGNSVSRRKDASTKIKSYIDQNLANEAVVMLGDFNEDITEPEGNGVFTNFKTDTNNYLFADAKIAQCSAENWSYPSWPSHLDHMLITNELFNSVQDIRTLKVNVCNDQYYNTVSDHRPVLMQLK